jgi:hypothetical protein
MFIYMEEDVMEISSATAGAGAAAATNTREVAQNSDKREGDNSDNIQDSKASALDPKADAAVVEFSSNRTE